MGCITSSGKRPIQKNGNIAYLDTNYSEQIIKFNDYDGVAQVTQIQQTTLKIDNIIYKLVLRRQCEENVSYFQVQGEQSYPLNQFYQNYEIFYHSNNNKLIQPLRQKKSYKQDQKIQKLIQVTIQKKIFLIRQDDKIRLKSLNPNKSIIVLKHRQPTINKICFDQFNSQLIFVKQLDIQYWCICVLNIQNRNVLRQACNYEVDLIVSLQKTNDFLVYGYGIGIILYNIDYVNMRINKIKILNYNILFQVCVIDNNNLLHLLSNNFYLKFDQEYEVIQKFKINFDLRKYHFNEKLVLQKQKLQSNINQIQLISEFINYQIEYFHEQGRTQHLISSNERYLAFIIEQSLIFHIIQHQKDIQICYNQKIKFIKFSTDSKWLIVILKNRISYFNTIQEQKKCNQYLDNVNESVIIKNNIILTITKQGQVKGLSKQSNKLIFSRISIKNYKTFDFDSENAQILVASNSQICLFNLVDRKLMIKQTLINQQCEKIQGSFQYFVLTQQKQLQLWILHQNHLVFQRIIMNDVKAILQGYSNKYCLRKQEQIIILDQQFNVIQQTYYQNDKPSLNKQGKQNKHLIDKWDQVIQENYILILQQQIKDTLKINQYNELFSFQSMRKIVLELKTRNTDKE